MQKYLLLLLGVPRQSRSIIHVSAANTKYVHDAHNGHRSTNHKLEIRQQPIHLRLTDVAGFSYTDVMLRGKAK